jgi:hypothetical protein
LFLQPYCKGARGRISFFIAESGLLDGDVQVRIGTPRLKIATCPSQKGMADVTSRRLHSGAALQKHIPGLYISAMHHLSSNGLIKAVHSHCSSRQYTLCSLVRKLGLDITI